MIHGEKTMATYTEKDFKSILLVRKFIDSWFWERYAINPYNGCQFGCIYCDSRSQKYYLPTDFENDIIIKKNAGEMLDKRLTNARTLLPDVVGVGGTTDPYQPVETKYENTRRCLEVLGRHRYPVHIATKSNLVLRDLDLLEKIGKNNWCTVSTTITTADPDMARFLETRAPAPELRFNAIKTIKEKTKHVQTGALLMPVVPFLSDSDGNLEELMRAANESEADYVLFGAGMTMRDLQAKWFLKHLKEKYPELVQKYEELYHFKYNPESYAGTYEPDSSYSIKINEKFLALSKKYNLPYRAKRWIPNDYRKENYIIAEKLLNEAYLIQMRGKQWSNSFWAGQNIQNLRESICDIAKRNELSEIRNVNGKVESFIKEQLRI